MDKAAIVTQVMNYKGDQGVSIIGKKLQEATEKALSGKKSQ